VNDIVHNKIYLFSNFKQHTQVYRAMFGNCSSLHDVHTWPGKTFADHLFAFSANYNHFFFNTFRLTVTREEHLVNQSENNFALGQGNVVMLNDPVVFDDFV